MNHPESETTFQIFCDHFSDQKLKLFLDINSKKIQRKGRRGKEARREGKLISQEKKSYSAKQNFGDVENCALPFQWRLTVEELNIVRKLCIIFL